MGVLAVDSVDIAFPVVHQVSAHSFPITGLNPFTLTHCGPSPPCVRFAAAVTDADATRGTWCLATASRAGSCLRLTQPGLARRTNKWVIKDPVEEINQVTDFYVAPDYQRTQRKVSAVKFKVRRMLQLPGQHSRQESLLPDYEDAPMVWELKNAGLSAEEAWKIWQQGFECVDPAKRPEGIEWDTYLHEKIDLLKRRRADGKVKSITGFLLKAIKENYTNAELTEAKQQQASKQQARTKYDQARQRQTLEDEKTQLEKARRSDIHNICKRLIADRPALADEAVQALLQDNAQFKKQYNPMKTFTENYEKGMFLWAWVDPYLEKQHPDHFETVRATYATRLQKIGDTLASLKQSSL